MTKGSPGITGAEYLRSTGGCWPALGGGAVDGHMGGIDVVCTWWPPGEACAPSEVVAASLLAGAWLLGSSSTRCTLDCRVAVACPACACCCCRRAVAPAQSRPNELNRRCAARKGARSTRRGVPTSPPTGFGCALCRFRVGREGTAGCSPGDSDDGPSTSIRKGSGALCAAIDAAKQCAS